MLGVDCSDSLTGLLCFFFGQRLFDENTEKPYQQLDEIALNTLLTQVREIYQT